MKTIKEDMEDKEFSIIKNQAPSVVRKPASITVQRTRSYGKGV